MNFLEIFIIFTLWLVAEASFKCEKQVNEDYSSICRISEGSVSNEKFQISNVDSNVLKSLSLYGIKFSKIPPGIFIAYPLLEIFHVCCNDMDVVSPDDFKNGIKLKKILIISTKIKVIPRKLFMNVPKVEEISIMSSPVTVIEKGAFDGLTNVKLINLLDLILKELPVDIFSNLTTLEKLSLSNCSLKNLPQGIFKNNLNLMTIDLQFNDLEYLPDGLFDNINELQLLRLEYNKLVALPGIKSREIFANKNNLQKIHISNFTYYVQVRKNKISNITCDGGLTTRIASLGENLLTSMECIRDMNDLNTLHLDNNKFEKMFPADTENFKTLRTLKINNNTNLDLSKEALEPLTKLRDLWVDQLSFGYENLRQHHPEMAMLYLTTKHWNCSYLTEVAGFLNIQKIYLRYIDEFNDFPNFECQLKMWEVSKFDRYD